MNRRLESKRRSGIERANELIEIMRTRKLTPDEIQELKKLHTGYGGIIRSDCNQFFTPENVIQFMLSMLPKLKDGMKILEPSCGSGAFLNALDNYDAKLDVTGIELSYELSKIASVCYPNMNIIQGDALDKMEQFRNTFDLVIGNPPFGKGKHNGFLHSKGRLEDNFVEMAFNCLKEGGEAILIVPDSLCANKSSQPLREWLINNSYYRASISLPTETFYFAGTNCKTTIIYFKKKYKGHNPGDYPIFMALCTDIG